MTFSGKLLLKMSHYSNIDGALFTIEKFTGNDVVNNYKIQGFELKSSTALYSGNPFHWFVNNNDFSLTGKVYDSIWKK